MNPDATSPKISNGPRPAEDPHPGSPAKKGRAGDPMTDAIVAQPNTPSVNPVPAAASKPAAATAFLSEEKGPRPNENAGAMEENSDSRGPELSPANHDSTIILQCKVRATLPTIFAQLAAYLEVKLATLESATLGDMTQVSHDEKDVIIHLKPSNKDTAKIIRRLTNSAKRPIPAASNFKLVVCRITPLNSSSAQSEALFLTLSRNVNPTVVAEAVAATIEIAPPLVKVNRGDRENKSLMSKMYYIVSVPADAFESACGRVITVNSGVGEVYGMLAPSVKWQFANGYRRFRCLLGQPFSKADTAAFIQALETRIDATVAFWDRGRNPDGSMTNTVSIAVEHNSDAAIGIDLLLSKSDGEEETLADGITFKIGEIDREEYERNEASRRQHKPTGRK